MFAQQVETPDGICWYTETFTPATKTSSGEAAKEWVVLIPSGEGDCHNLGHLARLLSSTYSYRVLTFDMPGMSRTTAPPEAYARVRPELLATQIVDLLDKMQIPRASFFGCSSGACTTIALAAFHSMRVKCGIVHEAPLERWDHLMAMKELPDEAIGPLVDQAFLQGQFIEHAENDGWAKWQALGAEYRARLTKNHITWVRSYIDAVEVGGGEIARDPENLRQRPLFWTVGGLNVGAEHGEGVWKKNFEVARRAGLEVNTKRLRCLHFPSVSVTEDCASWIAECVEKVDG